MVKMTRAPAATEYAPRRMLTNAPERRPIRPILSFIITCSTTSSVLHDPGTRALVDLQGWLTVTGLLRRRTHSRGRGLRGGTMVMCTPWRGHPRFMSAALIALGSLPSAGAHREDLRRGYDPPAGRPTARTWSTLPRSAHGPNEIKDAVTITFIGIKRHRYLPANQRLIRLGQVDAWLH